MLNMGLDGGSYKLRLMKKYLNEFERRKGIEFRGWSLEGDMRSIVVLILAFGLVLFFAYYFIAAIGLVVMGIGTYLFSCKEDGEMIAVGIGLTAIGSFVVFWLGM